MPSPLPYNIAHPLLTRTPRQHLPRHLPTPPNPIHHTLPTPTRRIPTGHQIDRTPRPLTRTQIAAIIRVARIDDGGEGEALVQAHGAEFEEAAGLVGRADGALFFSESDGRSVKSEFPSFYVFFLY